MYFNNGWGTEKDYNKGIKWIRMAAEQGAPDSQHNIGHMYFKGWGVLQDYIYAHMWANLAASNSLPNSGEHFVKNLQAITEK